MTRQQQKERAAMRINEYWARKNRKPSNADRIRAMTDEELSLFIQDIFTCQACMEWSGGFCKAQNGNECRDVIMAWLKQEAGE